MIKIWILRIKPYGYYSYWKYWMELKHCSMNIVDVCFLPHLILTQTSIDKIKLFHSEDNIFYLICIQSHPWTVLHCNTHYMEHLVLIYFFHSSSLHLYLSPPFTGSDDSFSKNFNLISFQIFFFWRIHFCQSETLNEIV